MLHIVLFQPEIPPNTGNIIRLCANFGCRLHVIEPLGFELDDKRLRRAGLDYREWAAVERHKDFEAFFGSMNGRLFAFTTKAKRLLPEASFRADDYLLFGPESRGLPLELLESLPEQQRLRIPMKATSRSLNLANTVAIAAYAALTQIGFADRS